MQSHGKMGYMKGNGGKAIVLKLKGTEEVEERKERKVERYKAERPKSVHGKRPPLAPDDRKDAGKILYPKPKPRPQSAFRSSEHTQEQFTQTGSGQVLRTRIRGGLSSNALPCPVTNPDLPPVSEMEHMVDRCFCYLCTCGKHICPRALKQRAISASMYATNYRVDYARKSGEASKQLSPWSFIANRLPMDLQTIHQRDFQPYTIEQVTVPAYEETQPSVPFISRSSYQEMFPNWGPRDYAHIKPSNLPYRGSEVKLDPKTTYSVNYQSHHSSVPEASKPPETKCVSLIRTGKEFYGQTTNKGNYRPFRMEQMAVRARVPKEGSTKLVIPVKHFKTTYEADYVAKKLPVRPLKMSHSVSLF